MLGFPYAFCILLMSSCDSISSNCLDNLCLKVRYIIELTLCEWVKPKQ